jgi:hypothetical protein
MKNMVHDGKDTKENIIVDSRWSIWDTVERWADLAT